MEKPDLMSESEQAMQQYTICKTAKCRGTDWRQISESLGVYLHNLISLHNKLTRNVNALHGIPSLAFC